MKQVGFTQKIEIVNCGKTKNMLNVIVIKWANSVITNLFTQFSEYVYNVNFDINGFESITSKKRRSFIDPDIVSMILTIINDTILQNIKRNLK